MKEVFLYGCEDCGLVIVIESDKGNTFYVAMCVGCNNNGRFYEQIIIKPKYDLFQNFKGNGFAVKQRSCDPPTEGKANVNENETKHTDKKE